jgi:succinate dehydrogenase hydrophobic anchor subunit
MMLSVRKPNESVWLWLAKIVSGLLVVVVILIHVVVNHLVVQGGLLNYAQVVAYLSMPGIALLETCFLIVVVTHSLIGARSIVLDLGPSQKATRIMDIFLVTVGAVAIVYGIWLVQTIIAQGKGV